MAANSELSPETVDAIKPYIKRNEQYKVNGPFEFNGKEYREIIFLKRSIKLFGVEHVGYIYISKDDKIVSSKNVQKELSRLAYFYELFFSEEKERGILASFKNNDYFDKDNNEFKEIIEGLEFLRDQGLEDADKMIYVSKTLPEMKEKNNYAVAELAKQIQEAKSKTLTFNEELLKKLYSFYEDVLITNFENVKLIATLTDYCDNIKDEAEKKRKKWAIRFKGSIVGKLMKVSDKVTYFKRIIKRYENVLSMTTSEYVKFLRDMNKKNIENKVNLIRD